MTRVLCEDMRDLTPLRATNSLESYISNIPKAERLEYQFSTVQGVLTEIQLHRSSINRADSALRVFTPLISFIDRHSAAVDMMAQNFGSPTCLIWGCLRAILRMARNVPLYFTSLLQLVEQFANQLCLYSRYDRLFHDNQEFTYALYDTYLDVIIFLRKARDALRTSCTLTAWLSRAWASFEGEFDEICQKLKRRFESLLLLSTFIHRDAVHQDMERQTKYHAHSAQALENQLHWDVISWLSAVDYHEDRRRNSQRCGSETCQWIFNHPFFQAWAHGETTRVGWVFGMAGIGKTVLCSSIIDRLEADSRAKSHGDTSVIYFFFDETDESRSNTLAMYRTLISQLVAQIPSCVEPVKAAFAMARKFRRGHMTWSESPPALLKQVLALSRQTFVVIDGMDECRDMEDHLGDLLGVLESSDTCRVLLLSRDTLEIRKKLVERKPLELEMTRDSTKTDVDSYFSAILKELEITAPEGLKRDKLLSQLSAGADGMFLWARFMAEELKTATCPEDVYQVAARTPGGLNLYYGLALKRLSHGPPRVLELARDIFTHVLCSPRPLTWAELQCSLSRDANGSPGVPPCRAGRLPYKSAVLKVCQPFIEYHAGGDYFRPAHLSVAQFFTSPTDDSAQNTLRINLPAGHKRIANILLDYLAEMETQGSGVDPNPAVFPLLAYATSHWYYHLVNAEVDMELRSKALAFLSCETRRRAWLKRLLLLNLHSFPAPEIFRTFRKVRGLLKTHNGSEDFRIDELEDILMVLVALDVARIQARGSCVKGPSYTPTINNSDKIMIVRDLARVYKLANRVEDGICHLEAGRALLEREAAARPEDSVWIANGLGILYDQQGRVERAIETQQLALALLDASQEPNEFDQILTINELGRLYRHQERFAESQAMHLRALGTLQQMLPDSDVQVIWTKSHLAKCYRMQGRLDEALQLQTQVLAVRVQLLGSEHAHVLWDMSDLAKCYRDLGHLATACRLQENSVRLREKVLGPSHHDTLWAQNDLGLMYEMAGKREEARVAHLKGWEGQKLTLGPHHQTTLWSLAEITRLADKQGGDWEHVCREGPD